MKPRPVLALVLAALAAGIVRAAPSPEQPVPDQLDLPTAVRFALDNNFAIREARERIKQQEGVVVEVRGRALPNVAANGSYQKNSTALSESFPESDHYWQVALTASQVLYAGGGVHAAIKGADLVRESAVLDLQGVINVALLDVRTKFYSVLLAREKIKVQEANIALLQQQLKDASARYRAGSVSSFEQLRTEVALANGQVPLITARNDFRIAVDQLRQALGFTTDTPENVRKVPEFIGTLDAEPADFDLQAALDSARANRPEILRLAKIQSAEEEAITTAKSNYYPNLSLFGGAEVRQNIDGPANSSVNGLLVGLQSQWNIFDGASTAGRVAQARSQSEQARLVLSEQTLAIDVEVRQAYSSWQEARELDAATKQTVGQAEESLRLATTRYSAGTATELDLLQARTDLTQARTDQLQSEYTYDVAVASLRKAMGQADALIAN
jgi:outer membrane protein